MDSTNGSSPQRGSGSDETFDRLRAADPAAGLEPDLDAIRATVTAKVSSSAADDSTTSAATSEQGSDAGVVDLSSARSRRRPARWLQVAAAAVGVAAVGTAGYAVGTQDGGSDVSADSASTADLAATESAPEAGAQAPFSLPSDESAASSADRSMIAGFGMRTLFTAVGLDDTPSAASAWGFDPAATFTPESALAVAQAVGLEGEPSLLYGAWHVGSTDWTGPALDVQSDSATSFSYYDPSTDPWAEGSGATAVDGAEATARLSEIMTSLGVDPAGFDLVVEDMGTATATTVSAYRAAGSVNDGQAWQLTVSSLGVSSLNGALAPLVDLGSYDVVGAATAVARLTDPRFGATADYGIMPFARAADDVQIPEGVTPEEAQALEEANPSLDVMPEPGVEVPSDDPAAVPTLPPSAVPGSVISWPVSEVAITGAELTTTTVYSSDGSAVLVPAYRLAGDDGSSWTVIAVTEEHLDFAAR
ncbi:hypothetical protein Sked_32440 [Sanguibacter keddieii DSM 10542]|uniref:Uncharacterized protein n=1 Tax=Sanguibacter keddieii (strain ATCC 51767 / DSM 10542 / NCFB 3025 / ST-74) TaxID=446469 RepID=D1BDD6_SANKS|nr:hypothetical protein [Sanguibacter keddieii]ACZ23140.1 hypothetical protein Sked_32440 [Sanguibacter keddieii DSM 10542]